MGMKYAALALFLSVKRLRKWCAWLRVYACFVPFYYSAHEMPNNTMTSLLQQLIRNPIIHIGIFLIVTRSTDFFVALTGRSIRTVFKYFIAILCGRTFKLSLDFCFLFTAWQQSRQLSRVCSGESNEQSACKCKERQSRVSRSRVFQAVSFIQFSR